MGQGWQEMSPGARELEEMLTGGHPNSLGRTIEVVELVLAAPARFDDLFECYRSEDEVVRLRVSSAMKRVEAQRPALLVPYIDRFIGEIGVLDQASAQWTLAQLFSRLRPRMQESQKQAAFALMKRNLEHHHDWIVLNHTMQTMFEWIDEFPHEHDWLIRQLRRHENDARKSVRSRAGKLLKMLDK